MEQYISKAAVVAEIEGKRDMLAHLKYIASNYNDEKTLFAVEKQIEQYESLISFLDTLEVKEVDVEGEISRWLENGDITDTRYDDYSDEDIKVTARHFFELGHKSSV